MSGEMRRVAVDMRSWSKTNLWRLPSGELAVRPGLRRIFTPPETRRLIAGFSVYSQYTGETTHYIFDVAVTGAPDLNLTLYTENFEVFQVLSLAVAVVPRGISCGVVQGFVMFGSPDMPTTWGPVGSGQVIAESVASTNPATTAIPVPRGILTSWVNRIVIANGPDIFVSDPVASTGGDPRTFVAENQNARQSTIFGLHEGAGGQLVVVTSGGVYGLDSAAAAVQIVGSNGTDWNKLHHHEATSLDSSCVVNGRVWALTRRGYMMVDTENNNEIELDQAVQPRVYGPRYAFQDYRPFRVYGGELGPIVAVDTANATHMHDLGGGLASWWNSALTPTAFKVRGVLRGPDGEQMLLCENGVLRMFGNMDGEVLLSTAVATQARGVLAGIMPTRSADSPTVREMHPAVSLVSSSGTPSITTPGVHAAARGIGFDDVPPIDPQGAIIGTASWGTSLKFLSPALTSVGIDMDRNADDMGLEVATDEPLIRILPAMDVDLSASAPKRKTGRG